MCSRQRDQNRVTHSRSGAVLIVVLACMATASTILFGALAISLRYQRQFRNHVQMEQTHWLLDAGIDLAITEFESDPDFIHHSLATGVTLAPGIGSVTIDVIERNADRAVMQVTARLQGQHAHSPVTQRSRVFALDVSKTSPKSLSTLPD